MVKVTLEISNAALSRIRKHIFAVVITGSDYSPCDEAWAVILSSIEAGRFDVGLGIKAVQPGPQKDAPTPTPS
jgi:hypothetical protein